MEFRILEEVWSGKEVKFSHLKVFGCVSYVHFCKVEFNQPSCWLYFVINLLVF